VGAGSIESKTGVFVDLKTAREEGLISGKFVFDESMVLCSKLRPYLPAKARGAGGLEKIPAPPSLLRGVVRFSDFLPSSIPLLSH
jgi:hypothetical protein